MRWDGLWPNPSAKQSVRNPSWSPHVVQHGVHKHRAGFIPHHPLAKPSPWAPRPLRVSGAPRSTSCSPSSAGSIDYLHGSSALSNYSPRLISQVIDKLTALFTSPSRFCGQFVPIAVLRERLF